MVAQTHMGQRARKAREQDVHSTATARNQLAQTYPLQLALFQTFFRAPLRCQLTVSTQTSGGGTIVIKASSP